jgi:hypothetical protein
MELRGGSEPMPGKGDNDDPLEPAPPLIGSIIFLLTSVNELSEEGVEESGILGKTLFSIIFNF